MLIHVGPLPRGRRWGIENLLPNVSHIEIHDFATSNRLAAAGQAGIDVPVGRNPASSSEAGRVQGEDADTTGGVEAIFGAIIPFLKLKVEN